VANLGDGGSSDVYPPEVSTLLDGIREAFPSAEVVHHATDALMAEGADLCIVVVGCTKADEGEFIDVGTSESMMTMFPPAPPAHVEPETPASGGEAGVLDPEMKPVVEASADRGMDNGPADLPTFAPGGDRRILRLSSDDEGLIVAALNACPRLVVVVMGGSAVVMPWLDDVPATLVVWYPGMEGGAALGDVLTGISEPGGRLPFALPYDQADLVEFDPDADAVVYGLYHGQWKLDRDGVLPQRPFGAGIGYSSLVVDPGSIQVLNGRPEVTAGIVEVDVVNVGPRHGPTVVFLFAGLPGSTVDRPVRRLVGFRRVTLDGNQRGRVAIAYDLATVAVRRDGGWYQEPGRYVVDVGTDAATAIVTVTVDVPFDVPVAG
jgi:beta-glucosidase